MEIEKIKLFKKIILSKSFSNTNFKQYEGIFLKSDFSLLRNSKSLRKIIVNYFNQTKKIKLIKEHSYENIVHIGGSGGDSVKSINVSSLSAMILASMGYKVIKSGSRSYTSLLGASDFFEIFVRDFNLKKKIIKSPSTALDKYNFYYSHAVDHYPWLDNYENIKKFFGKKLFDTIFEEMDRNVLNSKIKIDGINSNKTKVRLEHYKEYNYHKVMILHGLTNDKQFFLDEASNVGDTKISYFFKNKIVNKILKPEDFRVESKYKVEDIILTNKDDVYQENIAILKGSGKKSLVDLVAINVAIYMCFLENFKIGYKESYNKSIKCIRSGMAYNHFLNKI